MKPGLLILTILSLLFLACPKPSENKPPEKADCDPGFLPCEGDSTICCEVICPPGTLLGGQDSTECIPVECPPNNHLCGPDSTDCCLDTTSHNLTWEVDTLLYSDSQYLEYYAEQVAFINDTIIWVVGDFMIPDSTDSMTSFEQRFNLVEWNGIKWQLEKIMTPNSTNLTLIRSVFVIDPNTVWTGGWGPFFWDGVKWSRPNISSWPAFDNYGQINAIWASGPNDVFFVSDGGQINHWNGTGFERMATPTTVPLLDISGTGPNDVWASGNNTQTAESVLIHYNGETWSLIYEHHPGDFFFEDSLSGRAASIIVFPDSLVCVLSPFGVYTTTAITAPKARLAEHYWSSYPYRMRGNHANDLFVCGQKSLLGHYNGIDFIEYSLPIDMDLRDLDVRGDQVVAIGIQYGIGIGGVFAIRMERK